MTYYYKINNKVILTNQAYGYDSNVEIARLDRTDRFLQKSFWGDYYRMESFFLKKFPNNTVDISEIDPSNSYNRPNTLKVQYTKFCDMTDYVVVKKFPRIDMPTYFPLYDNTNIRYNDYANRIFVTNDKDWVSRYYKKDSNIIAYFKFLDLANNSTEFNNNLKILHEFYEYSYRASILEGLHATKDIKHIVINYNNTIYTFLEKELKYLEYYSLIDFYLKKFKSNSSIDLTILDNQFKAEFLKIYDIDNLPSTNKKIKLEDYYSYNLELDFIDRSKDDNNILIVQKFITKIAKEIVKSDKEYSKLKLLRLSSFVIENFNNFKDKIIKLKADIQVLQTRGLDKLKEYYIRYNSNINTESDIPANHLQVLQEYSKLFFIDRYSYQTVIKYLLTKDSEFNYPDLIFQRGVGYLGYLIFLFQPPNRQINTIFKHKNLPSFMDRYYEANNNEGDKF